MPLRQPEKPRTQRYQRLPEDLYYLAPSPIHGLGVYANQRFNPGEAIDLGIRYLFGFYPEVTPQFGSFINHSYHPNTRLKKEPDGYDVVATETILPNQELTMNYHQTPWFIAGPDPSWTSR